LISASTGYKSAPISALPLQKQLISASTGYKSAPISALPLQKQLISATVDFRLAVNLQPAFIKIGQSLAESSLEKNMGLMTFKANGFGDVQGKHAVIHHLVQEQTYFDGHGGGHLA